jgi:SAM-dependent methyltransferase
MDGVRDSQAERSGRGLGKDYSGTDNLEVLVEAKRYSAFLRGLVGAHCPAGARLALDFGAGIGTFSGALAGRGCRVLCIEPDRGHREALRRAGHETADLDDIADASVDYIFTLNVLEHIEAEREVLAILARKLRPGGALLIYVPAFRLLWSSMDDKVNHLRRYTRRSLRAAVQASGLAVEQCRYADSAGFFATLAYKALRKRDGGIDRTGLILFDRYAFPIGRLLDRLGASHILGKNVYCVARNGAPS